jgi:hypothetical protein
MASKMALLQHRFAAARTRQLGDTARAVQLSGRIIDVTETERVEALCAEADQVHVTATAVSDVRGAGLDPGRGCIREVPSTAGRDSPANAVVSLTKDHVDQPGRRGIAAADAGESGH